MSATESPAPAERDDFRTTRRRRWIIVAIASTTALLLIVISGGVWALTHQQRISDQLTVWQFEPGSDIETYVDRTTMTEEGKFLFYASKPSIENAKSFDRLCASQREGVGILGCYLHSDRAIHLFDVTDDRLAGLEEVVAVHEMLHAAWDRMSGHDQERLAALLEKEVDKRGDDTELLDTLEYYASAEPGERANELHSIVGTELADISPELESHYSAYLQDRGTVVDLHEKSHAVFTDQQDAITQLVAQINSLKAEIDGDYEKYNTGYDALNADIGDFNARADEGGRFTQEEFDAERGALLGRQTELDDLYASISTRVDRYDTLVSDLDRLNAEVTELNESINIYPRSGGDLEG